MLKLDTQTAVLLTIIGVAVTLSGLAFLLVSDYVPGLVILALGLATSRIGYSSIDG